MNFMYYWSDNYFTKSELNIFAHFRHVVQSEILFIQIMSSKKQPIIKDLAAFTYHMFKLMMILIALCNFLHIL